jgi:hypothetical protein
MVDGTDQETPVAFDVVVGAAVLTIAAGRAVAGTLRPLAGPLATPQRWPEPLRTLANIGLRRRRAIRVEVERRFREIAPHVVTIVLDELDLTGIVNGVIDEIDLPEIIRASTGSVAGDTVRDVRVQVMAADDTVARWTRWLVTAGRDGKRPQR